MVRRVLLGAALLSSAVVVAYAQQPAVSPRPVPVMPFIDAGACPGEGCVYRDWKALEAVPVLDYPGLPWNPSPGPKPAPLFTVKTGETVTAMTGAIVFTKPGRARVKEAAELACVTRELPNQRGRIAKLAPGDIVYLLTYHGEGEHTVWFDGCLGRLETAFYLDPQGMRQPSPRYGQPGEILERGTFTWWVKIRNAQGQIGWTDRPGNFGGKDLYGQ